jgi:hypothetical protein
MIAKSTIGFWVLMATGWAENALANGGAGHEELQTSIFKIFIVPLGVATIFSIVTTLTLGLKMAKNKAAIFPWHRRMASATLLLALCHATMVMIFH